MAVQRAISTYDLLCYKEAKDAVQKEDKIELEKILYALGLDISEPYELEVVSHRPLMKKDNEPWYGPRYVGNERQDKAYLDSGNSTWENKIDACRDPELRAELINMNKTGTSDKVWLNEETAKAVVKNERSKGI